jgi:hypothetical protein
MRLPDLGEGCGPRIAAKLSFGGRTAEFLVCRECGVYVGAQMVSDKGRFGVLNVLSLRPVLPLSTGEPMDYGAESPEGRRLRRESRWTPVGTESL